ncbi:MAG: pantoate--beta-alanine ligase [Bradymonadia bacterium]|jgi:pantoate--beta-alanine ligase
MSLFRAASAQNELAVASIFVNPTQFAPDEDLTVYPRDPEGDSAKCQDCGIDILWMPQTPSVYAADHSTLVSVEGLTSGLCGRSRPTHFDGVTTIVAKLFNLVQPNRAYFGQKDYQQLAVIQRMVRDLDFPIEVIDMPIIREEDGLAMSSRNAFLGAEQRVAGLLLSQSLATAARLFDAGERETTVLRAAVEKVLASDPIPRPDYIEFVDPGSLQHVEIAGDRLLIALAVHIGATRLLDNRVLSVQAC